MVEAAIPTHFESISTWLSPVILIVLVAIIFFNSTAFATHQPPQDHHHNHHFDSFFHHHQPPPLTTQPTRTFSILHRLKSINHLFNNHHLSSPPPPPTAPPLPPPAAVHEADIHVIPESEKALAEVIKEEQEEEDINTDDEGPTMDEVYKFIVQNKEKMMTNNSTQSNSLHSGHKKPAVGEIPAMIPRKLKKTVTQKLPTAGIIKNFKAISEEVADDQPPPPPPSTAEEEEEEEEEDGVDVRADDFIKKFWQHMRVHRLNSIQRYKKMITINATAK